ncbi:P-loop containing nucleoside triphosphate hydrolase protein [Artomyces pyxidatus]|uniref:P-loop containing nucleoside triphosphate hydrolase protein n=1 Tax=Artomyces pyxidatus TaxID=48021 RepID=A0ACB8T439_9AGAM|nr:P-loop containing nucleoside triphosphate hydrolase protein [Artomyces pyxidatus]
MDAVATELAAHLVQRLEQTPTDARLLIGISGIPASGKSTLTVLITNATNQLLEARRQSSNTDGSHGPVFLSNASNVRALHVGLDGWHLTRAQLDAFPDPKLAHDRRGIHWTFDGPAYLAFVQALRNPLTPATTTITAPSFDHALKDPTPHAIFILPDHRIVLIEGLYTFLSIPPWSEAGLLLDERWFVELDVVKASRRLVKRHVLSGVAKDLEEAQWRADENDMPNGHFIISNLLEPTRVIPSVEDPVLAVP